MADNMQLDVDEKSEIESQLRDRQGFTSEVFKIEIQGIPKYFGVTQAKKMFAKHKLSFHKLTPCGKTAPYMFVNFRNEEDRDKAIAVLNGSKVKGRVLKAFKAKPRKDPMIKTVEDMGQSDGKTDRPVKDQIRDAVCPLWNLPYDKQIEEKSLLVRRIMSTMHKEISKTTPKQMEYIKVEEFERSPVIDGYRNKCEFSVGFHPETKERTVGFRLASYKKGNIAVVGVDDLPIVSDQMKSIVKHFEKLVRASKFEPYNSVSQKGHWKQLTVRASLTGNLLAWAILNSVGLTDEDKNGIRAHYLEHMTQFGGGAGISSLYIQFVDRKTTGSSASAAERISGSSGIVERLLGLEFLISPEAFFQVNTLGAERLFQKVAEVAVIDEETIVLDVCCGTGTIGLSLASRCRQLFGIELNDQAVEDAKLNAERNGIRNASFLSGKAEFLLPDVFRQIKKDSSCPESSKKKIVAIVDPPRAGLHPKALQTIRNNANINKLVYVSCDAKAAMANFVSLCRPTSNNLLGDPFVVCNVVPVDLFPHTRHFELILVFERKKHDQDS